MARLDRAGAEMTGCPGVRRATASSRRRASTRTARARPAASRSIPARPRTPESAADGVPTEAKPRRRIPWHLKALLGVFAIYLGYRTAQGIEWLAHNL